MSFTFSEEQEELRRTIRRFCEQRSPSAEVRRLMETEEGYDEAVWKQMAQELGLQGIAVPEGFGGQGFGFVELGIVLEELGRALAPAPFLSTVWASIAILNAGTEEQKRALLPGICAGERIGALAFAEPDGRWDAGGIEATATPDGDGFRLEGAKSYAIDGHLAHTMVVAARDPGSTGEEGVGLFVLDGDADGASRASLPTMDPTRKQAAVELAGARAARLGDGGWEPVAKTLHHAAICLAAESAGGAQRCLDMAVDYAKSRVQFGRPIGQFQAIKHRCADMLLTVESAKTAAYYAMWTAAADDPDLPVVASLAKAFCTEAYFEVASENIQVHGGIGFTWEHDAHLYYKRAKSSELMLGDPTYHRERIADLLGI